MALQDSDTDQPAQTARQARQTAAARPADDRVRSSRRRARIAAAVFLSAAAVIASGFFWLEHHRFESTDDAYIDADIVQITPRTSGRVLNAPVKANMHVRAGDILVELQDHESTATLALRKAQTEAARAQLGQAKAKVEEARSLLQEAVAGEAGPEASAQKAQSDFARRAELRREDPETVSPSEFDQFKAAAESATSAANVAERHTSTVGLQLRAAENGVAIARSNLAAAKAEQRLAQVAVDRLTIKAPISGKVARLNINVGSVVSPQNALMALVPDELYITANFKETQLDRIRPGQPVELKIDAYPGQQFRGRVESIQPGAGQAFQLLPPQNATGNYVKIVQRVPVRISVDTPDNNEFALGPGMSVTPRVRVKG